MVTDERLSALLDARGLDVSAETRAAYRTLLEGSREALQEIRETTEPTFETLYGSPRRYGPRTPVTTPGEDADPYNAWISRCRIEGATTGPLADLALGIKDNIAVADVPCTAGAVALESFVPEIDATVVGRLLGAGATVLGKQNMDAFAMGDAGELQDFGPTRNPHDDRYLAGGSSSGSGAAVAAGECDAALGTDQAGSVRTPAAWCGVVGCKPTYGLVPYTGVFGMDFGFDHVGVLSRSVETNARVLEEIAGEDRQDGCRLDPRQPRDCPTAEYTGGLDDPVDDLTVGVIEEGFGWPTSSAAVDGTVRDAIDGLTDHGVTVETVSIPHHRLGPAIVGVTAALGAASTYLQGGAGTPAGGWHWTGGQRAIETAVREAPETLSEAVLSSLLFADTCELTGDLHGYARAKNHALALGRAYDDCLDRCDVLALPTSPRTAIEYDPDDGIVARVERLATLPVNTGQFNQTGHPAISVPCGTVDGLPVGLQLVGHRFAEPTLYRLATRVGTSPPG